jgi:predicted enzyme related to lactoylglutathione lyase
MSPSIQTRHAVFAIDCPDAVALSEFYATLLGWEIDDAGGETDWIDIRPPHGEAGYHIACQRIDGYRAPEWPEGEVPQQAHLDFYVDSIAEAEPRVLAAGGRRHPVQPAENADFPHENGSFTVYLDPAGHPFCLCQA